MASGPCRASGGPAVAQLQEASPEGAALSRGDGGQPPEWTPGSARQEKRGGSQSNGHQRSGLPWYVWVGLRQLAMAMLGEGPGFHPSLPAIPVLH